MRDHSRNATKKVPEGGGTHHMQAEEGKVPNQNPKSTKQREEGPTTCKQDKVILLEGKYQIQIPKVPKKGRRDPPCKMHLLHCITKL